MTGLVSEDRTSIKATFKKIFSFSLSLLKFDLTVKPSGNAEFAVEVRMQQQSL